jgi:predicted transglutaminase-like cysteine proteinase
MSKISPQRRSAPNAPAQSFLRAFGHRLHSTRLGDLLVAGGLISEEQLSHALSVQKTTREPLGRILVREGALSAVQLYRKLTEQWCLKASAAGLTMMMQMVSPTMARAADDTATATVQLAVSAASQMSPATARGYADNGARTQARAQMHYSSQQRVKAPAYAMAVPASAAAAATISPAASAAVTAPAAAIRPQQAPAGHGLFGTAEVRSRDISAFTKWTTVMARFEQQMGTQGATPRVQAWKASMQRLRGKSDREIIAGVNDYINKIDYIEDSQNYKKSDYWATPLEFFARGGDCEDFAIAKYASLRALGFGADQMRIAIVQDKIKNIPHAILIVYSDEGTFVLDNQDKRTRYADDVNRYRPIFSINSNAWWLHKDGGNA